MSDTKIGKYIIFDNEKHKLGMGAAGTVYTGVDTSTPKLATVAAKKVSIYKQYLEEGEFEKEADLLLYKIPPHDNIIKVYDFSKIEYVKDSVEMLDLWLIMEYCDQGNLQTYAMKRELSVKDKFELIFQMALAVDHLHNCKPESVSHRDIKPQNVLLTGDEESPTVKLADFGVARTVTRNIEGKSVTMYSLAGTPHYVAPEQTELDDKKFKYSKKIDIFSLAVTWLALLEVCKGSIMAAMTGKCDALSISCSHQYQHILFYVTFIEGHVSLILQDLCSPVSPECNLHIYVHVPFVNDDNHVSVPQLDPHVKKWERELSTSIRHEVYNRFVIWKEHELNTCIAVILIEFTTSSPLCYKWTWTFNLVVLLYYIFKGILIYIKRCTYAIINICILIITFNRYFVFLKTTIFFI